MQGISLSAWSSTPMAVISFRQAISSCVDNLVGYDNIDVTDVSDGMTGSTSREGKRGESHFRVEAASIVVTYHLIQYVGVYTEANITSLLTYSIENGYFTVYIQGYGEANGAMALTSAYSTADDFQIIDTASPTPQPTRAPAKSPISMGVIAGIVVGTILAYVVFVLTFRVARREHHKKKELDGEDIPHAL